MLRGRIGTVVCDDHDGRSRGPARPIGAPAAVAVRPGAPLPGPVAASFVQICCKGPDRAGAPEENR